MGTPIGLGIGIPKRLEPEAALAHYGDQAKEDLVSLLLDGKNVHGCNTRDVFDCVIDEGGMGYHDVLELLEDLVALDRKGGDNFMLDAHDLVGRAKAMVERFVDAHPDWIQERAEEIDASAVEDYLADRDDN